MNARQPILITGSPRSGTTWVGKMLAFDPAVHYFSEPFNPANNRADLWFPYVTAENEPALDIYYPLIKHRVELRYDLMHPPGPAPLPVHLARRFRQVARGIKHRLLGAVPLFKDPIAFFSAEWLAQTFDMRVVVLIRHPAAVVSSFRRYRWAFDFAHLARQPHLLRDHLKPFANEIKYYAIDQHTHDPMDMTALLWCCINLTAHRMQDRHQDWVFLRHEDLSTDPMGHFEHLYDRLGLRFSPAVRALIEQHTGTSNPAELDEDDPHRIQVNSQANVHNWKTRLTPDEIDHIRTLTENIWPFFYEESDW